MFNQLIQLAWIRIWGRFLKQSQKITLKNLVSGNLRCYNQNILLKCWLQIGINGKKWNGICQCMYHQGGIDPLKFV